MNFGSSMNREFKDLLQDGWTEAAFFSAVEAALLPRFFDRLGLTGTDRDFIVEVMTQTIRGAFRKGVALPTPEVHWEGKAQPNRCRLHLHFPEVVVP